MSLFRDQSVDAQRSLAAPTAAGYVLGYVSVISMPIMVGALMQGMDLSEKHIGLILGAELLCIALSSVVLSSRAGVLSLQRIGLCGAALALFGHGFSVFTGSLEWFVFARAVAGLGEGMALSAANSAGASAKNPDRIFAIAQIVIGVMAMLLVTITPYFLSIGGYKAGLLCLIAVVLLCLPVCYLFPKGNASPGQHATKVDRTRFPHKKFGVLVLAAFAFMSIADIAMWMFTEQMGARIGVDTETVGILLGIATGLGLLGAAMAAVIGDRFGRLPPIVLALLLLASANLGLGYASHVTTYAVSLLPLNMAILFLSPYFLGVLSSLDSNGSWTTASGIVQPLAFAVGPIIAGTVAGVQGGYQAVGLTTAAFAALALLTVVYVYRASDSPFTHVSS